MIRKKVRYPVGVQSFEKIRTEGALYVDKTGIIAKLISDVNYAFLSRPRRFGKSLLLSTIEAYFQGKKHLFEGLEISKYEENWEVYPVFHFDLSGAEANNPDDLQKYLLDQIKKYEIKYDVKSDYSGSVGSRFGWLIENVSIATDKGCVILVDEYDKDIQETIDDKEALEKNQQLLRPFFAQLKSQDQHIKFAMVTGVARFRHYTIFSGANNLDDISFMEDYASICGITFDELNETSMNGFAKENEKSR